MTADVFHSPHQIPHQFKREKSENLVVFNEQMKKRVFQLVQEEIHV